MPITEWKHFYRSGLCCVIAHDEDDCYFGYIGFPDGHALHGARFTTVVGTRLYGNFLSAGFSFENRSLDALWWLGFSASSPYSYMGAVQELQAVADSLGDPDGQTDELQDSGGFEFL